MQSILAVLREDAQPSGLIESWLSLSFRPRRPFTRTSLPTRHSQKLQHNQRYGPELDQRLRHHLKPIQQILACR